MKVLMQNRPTTFSQRGGDTIVIERLRQGLEARGVHVTLDLQGTEKAAGYDLVHLFNFVLPDLTRAFAERAHRAGTPYVVTTLNEDVPVYRNQAIVFSDFLIQYVERGQSRDWYSANKPNRAAIAPCERFDNTWTVEHAAALFSNGESETRSLRRDYRSMPPVYEIKLGHEVGAEADPALFIREYGLRDFILCVGRFEFRKNQLMLLRALEDCDLPVVLAGGGFTYQPAYDKAVRAHRRRGRTLILERISAEMLASAYAAARVHALPSWYELPGLVTLEAAAHGCSVVAARLGTTPDYLEEDAFYCDPSDEDSVRNAVMAAYYAPPPAGLRERCRALTWERTVEETYAAYAAITQTKEKSKVKETSAQATLNPQPPYCAGAYDSAWGVTEFQEMLERGEMAARNKQYNLAHEHLERAERMNPASARALRARGAVYLAENILGQAELYFRRAIAADGRDARALSGLGMCELRGGRHESAYGYFVRALHIDSEHLVTILQLLECSYALNRFHDLITFLDRYTTAHEDDLDMKYCLAGALYKHGDVERARWTVQCILTESPNHLGAKQLEAAMAEVEDAAPEGAVNQGVSPCSTLSSGVSLELARLEETKRFRDYEAVKKGCTAVLSRTELTQDERDWALLLGAEADVLSGRLEPAALVFQEVLARNPRSVRALCGQGALAANAGEWPRARRCFEEAHAADRNNDIALAGLGLCSSYLQDPQSAWNYYQRALAANPENSRALLGILEIGYRFGRLQEVESALVRYLELHPADLEFQYSLAGCYFAQDKLQEALETVERITLFNPSHERALELRGLIAQRCEGAAVS